MRRIPHASKVLLFVLGGLAGVLVLAALAVLVLVDPEAYKSRVEATASAALGMSVTVEGRLRIGFIPRLHATLENVRVRNRESELAFVEAADVAIELLPLFRQELRYGAITLNRARISVVRGRDGRYNFQKPPGVPAIFHALELQQLSFPELMVVYADKLSGSGFESRNCKGELTHMRHPGGAPFLMKLSVSGQFACGDVRGKEATVSDLEFSVEAKDGVYMFKPVTMRLGGGQGSGSLRMDRSVAVPVLHLDYALTKFRVADVLQGLPAGKSVSGLMDFSTSLSMRGRTRVELRQTASGEMSLSGMNLALAGVDLDQLFSKYDASQNFNLFDVTTFFLAGPLGLVVTKGYQYSTLALQTGGSTQVRTVVSRWKVEKGVAHARDVALATSESRVALQGGLDFVDDEYDEVFVALVDANGCAKVRQRIRGPFGNPVIEKPNVMTSLAGPLMNLLGKAKDLFPGTASKCEVFYNGSVAAPK